MINFKNITVLFIALFILLGVASLFFYFPGWIYFILIASWFFIVTIGSFIMRMNFFLPAVTEHPKISAKNIAITFDDGPNALYTQEVLDLLDKYNAKATFFCVGKNVEKHPKLASEIQSRGHEIGNHSFSHKATISFLSTRCWIREIETTDIQIQNSIGHKPRLFRPPFGVTTPHLAKAINFSNHTVVGWTVRPFDTTLKNEGAIIKYITKRVKPGAIILLHDTHHRIPEILEYTLQYLQQNNYKAVSISELMNEK